MYALFGPCQHFEKGAAARKARARHRSPPCWRPQPASRAPVPASPVAAFAYARGAYRSHSRPILHFATLHMTTALCAAHPRVSIAAPLALLHQLRSRAGCSHYPVNKSSAWMPATGRRTAAPVRASQGASQAAVAADLSRTACSTQGMRAEQLLGLRALDLSNNLAEIGVVEKVGGWCLAACVARCLPGATLTANGQPPAGAEHGGDGCCTAAAGGAGSGRGGCGPGGAEGGAPHPVCAPDCALAGPSSR
jgi:hypothetical protein